MTDVFCYFDNDVKVMAPRDATYLQADSRRGGNLQLQVSFDDATPVGDDEVRNERVIYAARGIGSVTRKP